MGQDTPQNSNSDAPPDEADGAYMAFQQKVKGTNINEQTLLATDYLNHFNEIAMLLEMVPDMPDILDDAKAWTPKSYQDHTRESTFTDRDLAVEAYDHTPQRFRQPFETTIEQINRLVAASIERLTLELGKGHTEQVRAAASVSVQLLYRLIDHASAIIHGSEKTMDQAEIDQLLD